MAKQKTHAGFQFISLLKKNRDFKIKWNAILPCFHRWKWRCLCVSGQRKENSLKNMGCFWRRLKHFRQTQSKPFDIRWYWPSHLKKVCGNNVRQIECSVDSQRGKTWPLCSRTDAIYSSLSEGTCLGRNDLGSDNGPPARHRKSSEVGLDQTRWRLASALVRPSSNSNKLTGVNKVWIYERL